VHRILPASDPTSSINPANLVNTCSRCHAQATPEFAASYAHTPKAASMADRGAATVRSIYAWLIALVIGGMLLHNMVLLRHDLRDRWTHHRQHATHERLNRNEIIQHTVLFVTFFLLVMSGFALKYDQTFWARWLEAIGMSEGVRRVVHRSAAVGMILGAGYHLVYLGTRRGREQIRYMLPRGRDVRELAQNISFHLGRTGVRPAFARFRYIEKAEYWALIWGTAIMAVTGLVLWFPDQLRGPTWFLRVAEAIHLYEAWLALLAVVVWHFFFVMLRPGTFPVSFTFLTGRMEPEELAREHPEEYRTQYQRSIPESEMRPPP
jgi:cytochrome b subunit of formate dehydrogenase